MHILCNEKELNLLSKTKLPWNTTIVVEAKDGTPLQRWRMDKKTAGLELEVDFVENARPFQEKEKVEFKNRFKTQESIIDYFIRLDERPDTPQREYRVVCDLEYELLKFIRHSGTYVPGEKPIGLFNLHIKNTETNLKGALAELDLLLARYKKHFPKLTKIDIRISEHTCSEFGVYTLVVDTTKEKATIKKTTYGRTETFLPSDSYIAVLEFIRSRLPADRPTGYNDEDYYEG